MNVLGYATLAQLAAQSASTSQTRSAVEGSRAHGGGQADLDFWRQVFDDAQGQAGLGQGGQARPGGPFDAQATGRRATQAWALASVPMGKGEPERAATPKSGGQAGPSQAVLGAAASTGFMTVGGQVFIQQPVARSPGVASTAPAQDVSPVDRLAQSAAVATQQAVSSAPSALRVHVSQNAQGDWCVTLRSNRALSASQALSAVAEAMGQEGMPQGRIEEVILNGQRIYTQPRRPNGGEASIIFELHC